ncbi:MAG: transglycosylase SLT domain-containing protein [Burkholderiales bacterium]|nr:transglycosylase SLT domain-containing protein [Burkholderiales bacterium]
MARARCRAWALLAASALLAGCASLVPPATDPVRPPPAPPAAAASAPPLPAATSAAVQANPAAQPEAGTTARATSERHLLAADDAARADLWQRVRDGFAIDDLADDDAVQRWRRFYADRPEMVARMFERGGRYLFHIVEEVDRRGMPMELALLPFIESAFDPRAVSSARAAGIWQFIPSTGLAFDLRQNAFRDDRRDVVASTEAALDYLQKLHARFGHWHLALAAYNWGEGSVQRAQRRNLRDGRGGDYAGLRMPEETRQYVPKLLAVRDLVRDAQAWGIALPPLENHPAFLAVPIERDIDLALAARMAGLREDEFRRYNPQLEPPLILAAGTPQLLLPYDAANRFVRELAAHDGALASWTAWVAPRTLTVAEAARLTGMGEDGLRRINRIPPRMKVLRGSTLLVPRSADVGEDVALEIADHGTLALAPDLPPLRRVVFKVGPKGDTVAGVARRHRVAAREVARWNKISPQARLRPGARVVLMLPTSAPRTASVPVREASTKSASTRSASGKPASTAKVASSAKGKRAAKAKAEGRSDAESAAAAKAKNARRKPATAR